MSKYNKAWFWCTKRNLWNTTHSVDTYVKRTTVPLGTATTAIAVPVVDGDSEVDDDGTPLHPIQEKFSRIILDGLQRF